MFVSGSVEGRLLAVHLLNVREDCDVDRGLVSSETEYFGSGVVSWKHRHWVGVANHTSRYTQTHW
jgi:hypothetical protein